VNARHVGVQEAHQLQTTDGYTYVDVRSVPEFENGHPTSAHNVPLLHYDSQTGRMTPNAEFPTVMQANYQTDAKLLIGCQVGGRSARVAEMLAAAGYDTAVNVKGGFGGFRVEMGSPEGVGYEPLRQNVGGNRDTTA
jgi:rhodanese-related sulfurtransferase